MRRILGDFRATTNGTRSFVCRLKTGFHAGFDVGGMSKAEFRDGDQAGPVRRERSEGRPHADGCQASASADRAGIKRVSRRPSAFLRGKSLTGSGFLGGDGWQSPVIAHPDNDARPEALGRHTVERVQQHDLWRDRIAPTIRGPIRFCRTIRNGQPIRVEPTSDDSRQNDQPDTGEHSP